MKKLALSLLLLIPTFFWAAPPSDQTVDVHVISSRIAIIPGVGFRDIQTLNVLIDGKKYELFGRTRKSGLLAPGNYKAKLVRDDHPSAYESFQEYEFLYPDKKTGKFEVIRQTE